MKIYLDDCLAAKTLAELLKKADMTVIIPEEVGLRGHSDKEHFEYCRKKDLVLLTANPSDFLELHIQNPKHAGLLLVYQDNNPKKDLTFQNMVRIIQKIIKQKIPLKNQFIVLNHYR